jgi:hypothetical protein
VSGWTYWILTPPFRLVQVPSLLYVGNAWLSKNVSSLFIVVAALNFVFDFIFDQMPFYVDMFWSLVKLQVFCYHYCALIIAMDYAWLFLNKSHFLMQGSKLTSLMCGFGESDIFCFSQWLCGDGLFLLSEKNNFSYSSLFSLIFNLIPAYSGISKNKQKAE